MPEQDELITLLREIRDLVKQREKAYESHLAKVEAAYDAQLQKQGQRSNYWWVCLFGTVFLAVYAAMHFAK